MTTVTLEISKKEHLSVLKTLAEAWNVSFKVDLRHKVKDDTEMSEKEFYSMLDKAKKSKVKRLTPSEQKKLFSV